MTHDSHLDSPLLIASIDRQYQPIVGIPPSVPEAITPERAGFWIRGIAYVLDQLVLSAIGLLFFAVGHVGMSLGSYVQTGVLSFADITAAFMPSYAAMKCMEIAYFTYFHGRTGQTIGKMCCGLKVVTTRGEVISYQRALLRWAGYVVSSLILYIGFLWVAVDRNRQGWHDKIAATWVIKI